MRTTIITTVVLLYMVATTAALIRLGMAYNKNPDAPFYVIVCLGTLVNVTLALTADTIITVIDHFVFKTHTKL